MLNGFMGKLLFVNLTDGTIEERKLSEEIAKNFIGGYGIGARVLYNEMKPGVDPLGPDNVLGFIPGLLTGTKALFSGRYMVVCKSPVTRGWNDANSGGYFGPELRKAGFDGVFIKGAAKDPVYLWINNGKVEIRDASGLWGKDIVDTENTIKEELGEKNLRVAMIGPAGEKMSLIASVMNDGHRAAGRGGSGAVMGSKNLKAIAVRGTLQVPIANPEYLKTVNKNIVAAMKNGPVSPIIETLSRYGTGMGVVEAILGGDGPVKNWTGVGFSDFGEDGSKEMSPQVADEKYRVKKYACAECVIGCGAIYNSKEGKYAVGETGRPEYESLVGFGSLMMNTNYEAMMKCNHICNIMGMDTIAVAGTIAWAMECYEKGIITLEETCGIELNWGNADAIVQAVQVMADQSTEFGKLLALGSLGAANKLGKGFECLVTINGIELPMHDSRFSPGFSRTYYSDPTPGRHVKGGLGWYNLATPKTKYNYEGTGQMDKTITAGVEIVNCLGLCLFPDMFGIKSHSEYIKAVTGWELGEEDLLQTGMRIFNMRHAFNLREGWTPSNINIPNKRFAGEPPLETGPASGVTVDYELLTKNFVEAMDWNPSTWIPSRSSLEQLGGLEDVIKDLNI
ncbi:aldehyde ferredoxin oxidoreductase family protein [Desulfallas sp. Bu1-1]|uniref:aldehyde ferredoxin oxidoreductase family protein n=1 Tax=Desulfallas sp. Bu1-1 TaxID=2787620 RepID=UPI0018A0F4AD|nr:aldehyde ferredoxin oxidoreductase family protein [Desulfallas sp. Bu1-1]MBF7084306.1 aldehyde ferredoxin oxidoreductase family protein [Desulfallas sp. Bu1-1]